MMAFLKTVKAKDSNFMVINLDDVTDEQRFLLNAKEDSYSGDHQKILLMVDECDTVLR
jgi:hypothetical protein